MSGGPGGVVSVPSVRPHDSLSTDRRFAEYTPPVTDDALLASLLRAVEANPTEVPLRLHVGELLIAAGRGPEAVTHIAAVLAADPTSAGAHQLMRRALDTATPATGSPPAATDRSDASEGRFNWRAAEAELGDVVQPAFVTGDPHGDGDEDGHGQGDSIDVERVTQRLADVGGLSHVKEQLELSFLAPLQRPELRRLFGQQLNGGLILYGPPGCGKTFLARALAGELGAQFIALQLHEVLDMWLGNSEKNLHEVFQTARSHRPALLFIDELDAIGQRRSRAGSSIGTSVSQLLTELDGVASDNEGVFVIGATNHPWDVDPALRRPGRFDRMILVPPPDTDARDAVFRIHLRDRLIERIDTAKLARRTDGYSGADIASVCNAAAEHALRDSVRTGEVRAITMADLGRALDGSRPSTGEWFEVARNVVTFSNQGGTYDDLRAYMTAHRLL